MTETAEEYTERIGYTWKPVDRADIAGFIEEHHYSHNMNGVNASYCFGMFDLQENLVGACLYGILGMANTWKKYAKTADSIIELRRLVLLDDVESNGESWFIGQTLKWLKRNTDIDVVVSYADPNYGHEGIVYKATNFILFGKTSRKKVILFEGKKYHDKAIRARYKGELKPYAIRLREALEEGTAHYVSQEPKNIYIKYLRKRRGRPRPLVKG